MLAPTIEQENDNIYVNVAISPDLLNPNAVEIPAEYRVTKTIPILGKCDDYYLSVIRFAIPLNDVPLLIMPIVPNQANPNLTPLVIGISTGGINYQQSIIYISYNGSADVPPVQNQPTQIITPYYFIYEYQAFITMINTALALAFVASGLAGNCPYFYLTSSIEELSVVVDVATFAVAATPLAPNPTQVATIFMNAQLQTYLSAFPVTDISSNATPNINYQFNFTTFGFNNTIPPFTPAALQKQFTQEYSTLALWGSLRKILIISNSIPINSEYTPTNNSGISSTLPIISDFIPQIEYAGESRSIAYYNPTSQYRLVDMKSSEGLNTIDIKIYWQDLDQNIYPLLILAGQEATIKLGFFKKTLYKNGILPLKK